MNKTCVGVDENGYLHITGAELGTQACTYVISDSAAIELYPFNITQEEGYMLSGAIVGVWAVALCIRLIARMVLTSGD